MYAKRLERLNIFTYHDLLYHLPSRYEDYSLISKIGQLQEGELVTIQGKVLKYSNTYTRSRKTIQKVIIADQTGEIALTWFNQPFIIKNLNEGDMLSVSGRVEIFSKKLTFISPIYEIFNGITVHTGRIVPIYPETRGVSSKWLRKQISLLLEDLEITEFIPQIIRQDHQLEDLNQALHDIHFPKNFDETHNARRRLSFDEIFLIQLAAMQRKKEWQDIKIGPKITISKEKMDNFKKSLPFTLTPSQDKAIEDILSDFSKIQPMNRLLQGDVGSGKTVVAAAGMYAAFLNNFQSALMAPTEILAQQHFKTLSQFLAPFSLTVGLATSSNKLEKNKKYDVYVGTHALVAKAVDFTKLGLVIIDEQQRFGVEQRGILREKGENPHVLTMTATPIPRTIALTLYGELDSSYLTDMPKGRKSIKTWLVPNEKREGAYQWIEEEILKNKSQVFIICPFIEQSENMQTVKAATLEFERLQKDVFPNLRLSMLHGKLKAKDKDSILTSFRQGGFDILVATPVVEVGIDIPNATIIVIEGSERFGLSQLHQLRGRVGRGEKQSYCLLFTDSTSENSILRLKAMETMSQGAALSEFDLKMRGPGELYGIRQSGTRMLKIASFSDTELLGEAKRAAVRIFPELSSDTTLKREVDSLILSRVNPD
jgi:ATP-dependent DNA helicase RecG